MTQNHNDIRTRFIFDDMPIRGMHIRLERVWQYIVNQKHYSVAIRRALDKLLAAYSLLSVNLKNEGTLIVQIQGQSRLKVLVVETTSENIVHATTRWDETTETRDDENLAILLGENSVFVLTRQPEDANPWQDIMPLEGDSVAQMLVSYMKRSEQLDTYTALAADNCAAGALLLQRLPEEELDDAAWEHVTTLARTLTPQELAGLDAHHALYRPYHETPPRVFESKAIEFAYTYSRGKVSDMLLMLGGQEVGGVVAEQGSIQIDCDLYHSKYVFDETDVNTLFGADMVNTVRQENERLW